MDSLINLIELAIGENDGPSDNDRLTPLASDLPQPLPSKHHPFSAPLRRLSVIAELTECSTSYRSSLNPCTPNRSAVKSVSGLKEMEVSEKRTSLPKSYGDGSAEGKDKGHVRKGISASFRIDGSDSVRNSSDRHRSFEQSRTSKDSAYDHSFSTSVSSVSGKITWDGETEENIKVRENAVDRLPVSEFRPIFSGLEESCDARNGEKENPEEEEEEEENPDPIVYDSIELEPYDDIEQFKLNVDRFFRTEGPDGDVKRLEVAGRGVDEIVGYGRDIVDDVVENSTRETNRRRSGDRRISLGDTSREAQNVGKDATRTLHVEEHSTQQLMAHYRDEPSQKTDDQSSSSIRLNVEEQVEEFENMYGNIANSFGSFGADREDVREDGTGPADADCNEDILPEANMSFLFTSRDNEGRASPSLSEVSLRNDDSILGDIHGPCSSSSDEFENEQKEPKLPPSGRWSNVISGDHPSPGVFFSQKSGAMGDLAGVGSARKRPKFYSPALDGTLPSSKLRTTRKPCRLFSPAKNGRQNKPESHGQTRPQEEQTERKGLAPIPQSPEPEIQGNDCGRQRTNGDSSSIEKNRDSSRHRRISRTKNEDASRDRHQDRSVKANIPSESSSKSDSPVETAPRRLLCADTPTQFSIKNTIKGAISYRILWLASVKIYPDQGSIPSLGSEIITVERLRQDVRPREAIPSRAKSGDGVSDRPESQIMVIVDGKVAGTVDVVMLDCTNEGTYSSTSLRPARSAPPRTTSSGRDVNNLMPSSSAPRSKSSGTRASDSLKQPPPPSQRDGPRNHRGPLASSRQQDGRTHKPTKPPIIPTKTKPVTISPPPPPPVPQKTTPIAFFPSPSSSASDTSSSSSNCTRRTDPWVHFGPTQIGKTRRCLISICNPYSELLQLRATCSREAGSSSSTSNNDDRSRSSREDHRHTLAYPHDTHPPFAVPFTKLLVKERSYILLPVIFHPPESGRMSCDLVLEPMGNLSRMKRVLRVRMTGEGVSEG